MTLISYLWQKKKRKRMNMSLYLQNNKYIKDYDKSKESSYLKYWDVTLHKKKFSIKDFCSKCDPIRTNLLKKPLMKNFIFCEV